MLLPRLGFGTLLLASPLLGLAQTTPEPAAAPRYYVGLSLYDSFYQQLGRVPFIDNRFVVPVQLTGGYQFTPRLAVQLGVAYSGFSRGFFNSGPIYNGSSRPGYYENKGSYQARRASVSVLARYTLTRNAAHRMQFDALGGLGLEHFSSRSHGTRSDSVQTSFVASPFDFRYSNNIVVGTLGLGTRFRLSPQLELTYDFTLNRALGPSQNGYLYRDITGTQALGLRYRFGKR